MINNKDPLIAAVQKVMQDSYAERNAVKVVNEKFGVVDRRVLPRERQGEWDAAYQTVLSEGVEALNEKSDIDHPNKKKLDVASANGEKKPDGQLTSHDFKQLRSMKEEGDPRKAIRGDTVTGGSSVTTTAPTEPRPVGKDSQVKLKKMIMSIKEAKKAAMCEATLESIQEEIANNLAEQAAYIFENEGQEGLDVFLESLSEEQFELLQLHEKAAGGYVEYMQKKNKDAAAAAKTKETNAKLNAPGAKGPNAAAGPSPAQPQVAAKEKRTSDAINKLNSGSSTTTVKPKPKPTKPAPKAAAPKTAAPAVPAAPAAPVKKSTSAQRAQINRRAERDSIGPSGKPRQLQGLGVKTGTTIKKRPIGMGREK